MDFNGKNTNRQKDQGGFRQVDYRQKIIQASIIKQFKYVYIYIHVHGLYLRTENKDDLHIQCSEPNKIDKI